MGRKKSFPLQNVEEYGTVEVQIHSLITWALDGVSSQLHALAALLPGTEFTATIKKQAAWAENQSWTLCEKYEMSCC